MGTGQLTNCKNCGAELSQQTDGRVKCTYCGSEYDTPASNGRIIIDPSALPREQATNYVPPDGKANWGAWGAVLIVCMIFAILIMFIIKGNEGSAAGARADSIATDTAARNDRARADADSVRKHGKPAQDTSANATVRELATINVDVAIFKKLYANARKKYDQFSHSTQIYDKSSPRGLGVRCVYAYLVTDGSDPEIHLKCQYTSTGGLFIDGVIFNTDGENSTYSTWNFDRDAGNGMVWEWYDADLTYPGPSTLVMIANAKKAMVKYNGSKYYDVVTITRAQQQAIKRQLQIYKGLLLKYNKPKNSNGSQPAL